MVSFAFKCRKKGLIGLLLDNLANNKLGWILDITIAYPNGVPLDLSAIVFGHKPPCKTTLLYRLYRCNEVPQETEALTQWLYTRFEEKEKILENFYRTGRIPVHEYCNKPVSPHLVAQDCLKYLILHLFFITSTYIHIQMFTAVYEYIVYFIFY